MVIGCFTLSDVEHAFPSFDEADRVLIVVAKPDKLLSSTVKIGIVKKVIVLSLFGVPWCLVLWLFVLALSNLRSFRGSNVHFNSSYQIFNSIF